MKDCSADVGVLMPVRRGKVRLSCSTSSARVKVNHASLKKEECLRSKRSAV